MMPTKSPTAKSTKNGKSKTPTQDEIRVRAYELSQSRPGGDAMADWLEAERQLVEAAAPKPRRRKTATAA